MSMNVINVGRNNQRYPIKDLFVINNASTSQPQGALVILGWTPDGTAHTTIAATSQDIINCHQKAIVLDAAGIAAGATGRVRVQGPVQALLAANGTYSAEDPLICSATVSYGATMTLAKGSVVSLTAAVNATTNTASGALAFVPTTVASNSAVALASVIFDGTDVNCIRYL